ncbi:GNAT family N-acetyltransferase [Ammoniphilus sp. CFH 90114]|uniref:GNAT family N-acetyltransferase n=1 Tax=Ammoniphilus sp. CFH 90114 TaxID=2493665 RepID=UPI00100FF22F|nr:GNAT family N-acetyltransferase [Ammoniphilus sp. CFH 90114]RXT03918.1 N-acetyltransferase [Ammoniphilus sp. CFH 90114]
MTYALETERVKLKILTLEDANDVFQHFSEEAVTAFMDIEACKTIQEAEEIIQYHIDDAGCRWGLYSKATNEFMGTCGYHYLRKTNEALIAEVGFDLSKRYWSKGIMYEVMKAVLEFGFKELSLDIIDGTVEPENNRSIQLLEKLGFTRESELRDNLIYFYLTK